MQLSIQHNHIHMLVEADDKHALATGMKGFQISAAKHLNAAISKGKPGPRRRGTVFPDRYHAEIITTPTQARHALSYVQVNRSIHEEAVPEETDDHLDRDFRKQGTTSELRKWRCPAVGSDNSDHRMERVRAQVAT